MRFKRLNKGLVGFLSVSTLLGIRIPMAAYTQEGRQLLDIQPDANLQAQLGEVMHKLVDPKLTMADQLYAIGTLADARKDEERFFRQLVYFFDRRMRQGRTDDLIYMAVIVSDLGVTPMTMAKVLTPYLESPDPALRRLVPELLRGIETPDARGALDFSYYAYLLTPDPPAALVKYMYERSHGTALFTLTRVYGKRPRDLELQWAEHVVADAAWKEQYLARWPRAGRPAPRETVSIVQRSVDEAKGQLGSLSTNADWWVRLYAAEILRQHPAFRTPELVARLAADKHPLVREAMTSATGKPENPPKASPKPPAAKVPPPPAKLQIREEPDKAPPTRP